MDVEDSAVAAVTSDTHSSGRRKHRKFRYRGTKRVARKILFGLAMLSFWAAVVWLWYYLVNLPPR